MKMRFTLYPIYSVADAVDREPFDHSLLPFDVIENVRIESVADRFRPGAFDLGAKRYGNEIKEQLVEEVRYAIVHRYYPKPVFENGECIGEPQRDRRSEDLVRQIMACLRLIRPMRVRALVMRGNVRDDESFDVTGYEIPPLLKVPPAQALFKLRNQDCHDLRRYAPKFVSAMQGEVWKFKMAVQFHELGHFQGLDWKARYLLWTSAIESIFTTASRDHQGTAVATERIKWFLRENTSIYAPGDLTRFEPDPEISVGQIVNAIYNVRNHLAHGDRLPEFYLLEKARQGLGGPVVIRDVLLEAISFIVRMSLLKILREGLTNHFTSASAAEAYFDSNELTNSKIDRRRAIQAGRSPCAR